MNDPDANDSAGLDHIDGANLVDFLGRTRWFGGKGRPFTVSDKRRIGDLGDTGPYPRVVVLLVELTYSDVAPDAADAVELYQVPLSLYRDPEHRLDHAFIGWWEEPDLGWVHAYDAVHDRAAMARYLEAFGQARLAQATPDPDPDHSSVARVGGMDFHRLPGHELELDATPALFSGEQSNSSVYFGEDAVLKLFRKVTPGANPDVTTHEALTRAGSPQVAHLYGWIQLDESASDGDGESAHPAQTLHLGMLQQFLRTATDGWDLALNSVRNLYADPDLAARDAGGDFAGEAARLGEALREVHDILRAELPTLPATAPTPTQIAAAMNARLDAALVIVPGLAEHADRLRAAYAAVADLREVDAQTVHGRPAPGADAAHRAGMEDRRLRGRAGPPAGRADAARLALARRRRHAALLRLRAPRGRAHPRRARGRRRCRPPHPRRRLGRAQQALLPHCLRRRRPDGRAAHSA